ncbi:MAG: hypothetical protein IJ848_01175 [Alphaproteobacteria bacterium]|nr:hypothetical protein [Alphaproteobacteria bacterium]
MRKFVSLLICSIIGISASNAIDISRNLSPLELIALNNKCFQMSRTLDNIPKINEEYQQTNNEIIEKRKQLETVNNKIQLY